MAGLRPEPGLFDIEGWRQLVEDLRAEPADEVNSTLLFCAETHLAAISAQPQKMPAQAS